MSVIHLAAQRSYASNEAVRLRWRWPRFRTLLAAGTRGIIGLMLLAIAGVYCRLWWQYHFPQVALQTKSATAADVLLSDMHYVYVTKPFPQSSPPEEKYVTPRQEPGLSGPETKDEEDRDWIHTPDGTLATELLPEAKEMPLQERLMNALKEQQREYRPADNEVR